MTDHLQFPIQVKEDTIINVDWELRTIINLMWKYGIETFFSCEGEFDEVDWTSPTWEEDANDTNAYVMFKNNGVGRTFVSRLMPTEWTQDQTSVLSFIFDDYPNNALGPRITIRFPKSKIPFVENLLTEMYEAQQVNLQKLREQLAGGPVTRH